MGDGPTAAPRHPLDVPELAAMVFDLCDSPTLKALNRVSKSFHAATNPAVWRRGPACPLPAEPGPQEGIPAGVKKKLKAWAREWREKGELTGPWHANGETVARTRNLLLSCFAKDALRVLELTSIPRTDLVKRITNNQRGIVSLEAPFLATARASALTKLASALPGLASLHIRWDRWLGLALPSFPGVRRLWDRDSLVQAGEPGKVFPNLETLRVTHWPSRGTPLCEQYGSLVDLAATLRELSLAPDSDFVAFVAEEEWSALPAACREVLADPRFVSLRCVRHVDRDDPNAGALYEKVGGQIVERRWKRLAADEWWEWRRA
ncbi:hypothetical protein DFJ74DRAFT_531871 [Hyaloraphidium curvatum]|nr:hypothetical protein DFJ74DRAFT_531871 [Hyaloraphidium curvatum]